MEGEGDNSVFYWIIERCHLLTLYLKRRHATQFPFRNKTRAPPPGDVVTTSLPAVQCFSALSDSWTLRHVECKLIKCWQKLNHLQLHKTVNGCRKWVKTSMTEFSKAQTVYQMTLKANQNVTLTNNTHDQNYEELWRAWYSLLHVAFSILLCPSSLWPGLGSAFLFFLVQPVDENGSRTVFVTNISPSQASKLREGAANVDCVKNFLPLLNKVNTHTHTPKAEEVELWGQRLRRKNVSLFYFWHL